MGGRHNGEVTIACTTKRAMAYEYLEQILHPGPYHFSLLHQPEPFMNVVSQTSQVLSDYIDSCSHRPLLLSVMSFLHFRDLLCLGST